MTTVTYSRNNLLDLPKFPPVRAIKLKQIVFFPQRGQKSEFSFSHWTAKKIRNHFFKCIF